MNKLIKIGVLVLLLIAIILASNKLVMIILPKLDSLGIKVFDNLVQEVEDECSYYREFSTDEYYNIYTVKKGDTLLSIAQDQLGSTDRVLDIITQNKEKFPMLSLDNSFLEIGWTLKILKPEYGPYDGIIRKSAGRISNYSNGKLEISKKTKTYTSSGSFYPNKAFQLKDLKGFKVGDCVIVTYAGLGELISVEHLDE